MRRCLYARLLTRQVRSLAKIRNGNQVINCTANITLVDCLSFQPTSLSLALSNGLLLKIELIKLRSGRECEVLKAFTILSFMKEDHKMNFMLTQILQFADTRAVKGFLFTYGTNTYAYQ